MDITYNVDFYKRVLKGCWK